MYRTIGHQTEGSEGRNVVQAADGGYFITYYIYYASNAIGCITKFNCAGQMEWEKFYQELFNAIPVDVIPQADNGCLLLLSVRKLNGVYQNAILRLDASGNTIWTQRAEMQAASHTGCMVQDSDGSIYTCGVDSITGMTYLGTTVAKINPNGQLVWKKQYAEYVDHVPRVIAVTSDQKIIISGHAVSTGLPFTNIFVLTLNKNGGFLKRKVFTTYYDDEIQAVCTDRSGNICLTGYSYFLNTAWDMFFLKLDGQLNILQSKVYDGGTAQGEQARYITPGQNNTFALFGDEGGFNDRNPIMMKLDGNGNILWAKKYAISPQFTNYLFHGSQCIDGGYLMTGDARPINQFRIAPFMKTDADGNMGCYTSPISMAARHEIFTETDTSVFEISIPAQQDTVSVPYSIYTLPTANTPFCQSFIPCGTFTWQQDTICPSRCYLFQESTHLASSWLWTFENGTPSSSTDEHPPQICFAAQGPNEVKMILSNTSGSATYIQYIYPEIDCPFAIPNIFTPNDDGFNDIFHAIGVYEPFSLKIINRWGLEIFSSATPGKWWDGRSAKNQNAPSGVYFYILTLPESGRTFKGAVELAR